MARAKAPPGGAPTPPPADAQMEWMEKVVGQTKMPPEQLLANPLNFRRHSKRQIATMEAILDEVGFIDPVKVNIRTGRLVDGHMRTEIARKRGWPLILVDQLDLTEEQEAKAITVFDAVGDMATVDAEVHALAVSRFTAQDAAIRAMIAETTANARTPRPTDRDPDEDDIDPASLPPGRVSPGDLWALGKHRLLCGDATDPESVAAVVAATGHHHADLLFTDPPYNVDYEGGTASKLTIQNDALSDDAFALFLFHAFAAAVAAMRPGASAYVCHAEATSSAFRTAFAASGLLPKQCIIWVKDAFVLGRQDYQWRHEPILYGWAPGRAHFFVNDRTQDTVWEIPRPRRSAEHPTMKPIALAERAVANSSLPADVVLDPFVGSGTTLLACERLDRVAAVLDLSPAYCSVVLSRWEALTGATATRIAP